MHFMVLDDMSVLRAAKMMAKKKRLGGKATMRHVTVRCSFLLGYGEMSELRSFLRFHAAK